MQIVTLFLFRIRRDYPPPPLSFRPDPDDCREEWRNHKGDNVSSLDSGDVSVHTPEDTGCLLDMTGVACLKPGFLGFMMKFTFAATPVKGARNRKRRFTICYPISIPNTPQLPTRTPVVSTGSRRLSGGVENYCCADESRFMRCLGSLRKLRSSLDRTGVACLSPAF
jgi:hypothetical protein